MSFKSQLGVDEGVGVAKKKKSSFFFVRTNKRTNTMIAIAVLEPSFCDDRTGQGRQKGEASDPASDASQGQKPEASRREPRSE